MDVRRALAVRAARKRISGLPDPMLTNLASRLKAQTHADAAFVSFVTTDRAYVVGADGLPADLTSGAGEPVKESFCAHLVDSGEADGLIVNNTRTFPMLSDCPTVGTFGAWVGAPVRFRGQVIGAAGVVGKEPRNWPDTTLETVRKTAAEVAIELENDVVTI
jgi:GAF domain-containing protein